MKIGLQTWGTEGDVRPFLALAAAKRLCSENDVVIGHFLVWPLKIAALRE